jgi:hypothetical protein
MPLYIVHPFRPRSAIQLGLSITLTCTISVSASQPSALAIRGEKLFHGAEGLTARLAGHATLLPPALGACVNCHDGAILSVLEPRSAPSLSCAAMRQVRPRRGGPAVAYEKEAFCRTLRSGIDPNHVVLGRAMPRFEPDQGQCDALWAYLVGQEDCHDRN